MNRNPINWTRKCRDWIDDQVDQQVSDCVDPWDRTETMLAVNCEIRDQINVLISFLVWDEMEHNS